MLLALKKYWAGTESTTTLPNSPGRTYTGSYPYFVPRRKKRPLNDDEEDELEELVAMLGIEL